MPRRGRLNAQHGVPRGRRENIKPYQAAKPQFRKGPNADVQRDPARLGARYRLKIHETEQGSDRSGKKYRQ